MVSSYDATKKLGALSSYSRQVLLTRYYMRVLGGFEFLRTVRGKPWVRRTQKKTNPISGADLLLLGAFRVALTVFSGRYADRTIAYAPSDRLTEYKVKIKAPPHFIFSMATGSDSNPKLRANAQMRQSKPRATDGKRLNLTFGSHTVVAIEENDRAFHLLAREIAMVGKGVSPNSKPLADQRSEGLVQDPLWADTPFGQNVVRAQQVLARANVETDGAFDFWITWYEHLLAGTLPDQNL